MKGVLKALLVLAIGVFAASFAFADGASKEAKGTVSVTKGSDGKVTAVSIASDVGTVAVTPDNFSKFENWNGKKAEVSCVQKDGKYVATSGPKAVEEKKQDNKIKTDKSKKL